MYSTCSRQIVTLTVVSSMLQRKEQKRETAVIQPCVYTKRGIGDGAQCTFSGVTECTGAADEARPAFIGAVSASAATSLAAFKRVANTNAESPPSDDGFDVVGGDICSVEASQSRGLRFQGGPAALFVALFGALPV